MLCGSATAGIFTTQANTRDYDVSKNLEWVRDKSHALTIADLISDPKREWQNSNGLIPSFGYSDDVIWFRTQLANQAGPEHWYLAINYPLIRSLDLFVVRAGEVSELYQTGDRFEFSARPIEHRDFIFPLTIARQSSVDVYVKVSGPYALQMPMRLMDERKMLQQDSQVSLLHGLFFGFVLVMSVYNFFLFLGTRERCYFFYALFSVSIGMFQFVQQGFAYQLLWPREINWQNVATGIFIHFSLLSSFLFVSDFLELRRRIPWLFKCFMAVAAVSSGILLLAPFIDEFYVMRTGVLLSVPGCIISILGGWILWRQGRIDARVFSIAWAIFLLGVLMLALNKLGVIPRNFITEHGAEVGTVIELSLLAFALAGRINSERQQRVALEFQTRELERFALLSKERALELERMSNEQLERNVMERTDDLHKALADLSTMNRKLEQLSTQDPITGVGNENSFLRGLKQEWERAYRSGERLTLMVVELDGYRDVIADYGQVAAEECLKSVAHIMGRVVCRPADVITRYGDKVFGVLLPGTDENGARYLAQRIADSVCEKPFDFGICAISASISVGIASCQPTAPDSYRDLLLSAESAVYVAQNNGGNQIQLATVSSAS